MYDIENRAERALHYAQTLQQTPHAERDVMALTSRELMRAILGQSFFQQLEQQRHIPLLGEIGPWDLKAALDKISRPVDHRESKVDRINQLTIPYLVSESDFLGIEFMTPINDNALLVAVDYADHTLYLAYEGKQARRDTFRLVGSAVEHGESGHSGDNNTQRYFLGIHGGLHRIEVYEWLPHTPPDGPGEPEPVPNNDRIIDFTVALQARRSATKAA